jgi:hypothetical protein
MSTPVPRVDFDLITEHANKQGIPLDQIAIFYADLTEAEKAVMRAARLVTHEAEGTFIARFDPLGKPAFPEKATGVYYLAAD